MFTHSASLRCASFVHTLFAFTSGLARGPLSKLAGKQCKHSQLQSLRYRFADPPLCASACFRRRAIVAVSTPFVKAAKCRFALNMHRYRNKCRPRRSQLKTAGTQKVFPLSPLRTPLTPSPKNKECYLSLRGTGGTLFAQHYSCPAVLRCSVHR